MRACLRPSNKKQASKRRKKRCKFKELCALCIEPKSVNCASTLLPLTQKTTSMLRVAFICIPHPIYGILITSNITIKIKVTQSLKKAYQMKYTHIVLFFSLK